MSVVYDVVVVGSGAGGAPLAHTLTLAGAKVCMVERGEKLETRDFDRDEIEWTRRGKGVPSPRRDPHMMRRDSGMRAVARDDAWTGNWVGGSTLTSSALMQRADADDFRQKERVQTSGLKPANWPITLAELTPFYEKAERALGVPKVLAKQLEVHPISGVLDEAAKSIGEKLERSLRAIVTQERGIQQACDYRARCRDYACPKNAKSSTPVAFLNEAIQKGMVLRTKTQALSIELEGKRASGVVVVTSGGRETIKAKGVVLACGAVESARLLLVSGSALNPNGRVGRGLWFSGFAEVSAFFENQKMAQRMSDFMSGSPFIERTLRPKNMGAQASTLGFDRTASLQFQFVQEHPIHRAERVSFENGLLFGQALKERLQRTFSQGRTLLATALVESCAHPGAYVDLDPAQKDPHGVPSARITHFHHPRAKAVAAHAAKKAEALFGAAGAKDIHVTKTLRSHFKLQGGTARMGGQPADSVCDAFGQVWGIEGLSLCGGATLPSSLSVSPQLTIIANSLRIAEHLSKKG